MISRIKLIRENPPGRTIEKEGPRKIFEFAVIEIKDKQGESTRKSKWKTRELRRDSGE